MTKPPTTDLDGRLYTLGWRARLEERTLEGNTPAEELGWNDADHAIAAGRDIGWAARPASSWPGVVKKRATFEQLES